MLSRHRECIKSKAGISISAALIALCLPFFMGGQVAVAQTSYGVLPPRRPPPPDTSGSLGGLLGGMIRAGAQANAQKAWNALPQPMHFCMDRALSMRGQSTNSMISQGIAPNDARLASNIEQCQSLTNRELRDNADCNIVDVGVSVETKCNDAYAEVYGSQTRPVNFQQYIADGLRGANVVIMQVETDDARQLRLARQQQQQAAATAQQQQQEAAALAQQQKEQAAAAAQQEKEQAAATAAAEKQAEITRQKQAAADAAIHQSLAKRDQQIANGRRSCSAKSVSAFSQMFSNNSDHQVLASLLDTNIPPVKAYQGTVAWLPSTSESSAIMSALRDRIDYDAKRWGATISRSGGGDYSWDNLKTALEVLGSSCLWNQYDQLGVGAALTMSPQAVAAATGQIQATTDAAKVAVVVLSKIPSNKYFH